MNSWTRAMVVATATIMARAAAGQGTSLPEAVGPALLPAASIAALKGAERSAWTAYISRSRQLRATDSASMAAELRRSGRTEMMKAPYRAPDFTYFNRPDAWFRGDSAQALGSAILTWQTPSGGWSKRTDMWQPRTTGMSYYSETSGWHYIPTFDNGATTGQLRFLARLYAANHAANYANAYRRGLALLLVAQQPNGCWPQSFPLDGGYHDAVTFNDDVAVLVLTTLDEAASGAANIPSASERRAAWEAAKRGVACLVRAQVRVAGARTVWGQQEDPLTLEVVPARRYELAGLAGRESASIMLYLMSLRDPDSPVQSAVHSAATWFRSHALSGLRYERFELRPDTAAPPLWARLTEISTGRPIFANRDAVKLYDWNQLSDRRSGYGWFGREPAEALRQYEEWARVHPLRASTGGHE
jgi:PelA/Pel-15E family pectate lyase